MKTTRRLGWAGKVLSLALFFAVLLGMFPTTALAADQTAHGSEGIMAYHHTNASDPKYVDYDYSGAKPGYKEAPDLGVKLPWYVYCINQQRNARDYEKWGQHFRWRWNLGANKWLLDNSKNQNIKDGMSNPAGSEAYDFLARILYYGYPNNYGGGSYTYNDTQDAVEALMDGNAGKQNELYNKAKDSTITVNGNLYMFIADSDAKQIVQNTVGLAVWGEPDVPAEKPETYDDKPKENSASVSFRGYKTINGGTEGFDTEDSRNQFAFRLYVPDKFNNSPNKDGQDGTDNNGGYYTRRLITDMDTETEGKTPGEIAFGTFTFSAEDAGKTFTFRAREIAPTDGMTDGAGKAMPEETEGMTYDSEVFSKDIKVSVEDGQVKLTCGKDDVTNGVIDLGTWNNTTEQADRNVVLGTKVSAGNAGTFDDKKGLQLTMEEGLNCKTITDTVDYQGLLPGTTYILTAQLVSVDEKGNETNAGEAVTKEFTAPADGTGSGSENVEISVNGLEPYTKYVVYETLTSKDGADPLVDELKPTHPVKELGDPAQTILVGDFYGNFPFDPMGSPEGGDPAIGTVVSAGGQTATTQNPVTLSAETAAKVTEVTDQIAYVGMIPNATYKVTGTLMRVIVRNNKTYVARVATVTEDVVANGVGAGTEWTITFKNVKLQENTKYVVFEEVYDANGKNVAYHKEPDDPAQTIVVSGASSNTSPKTADRIWPAALLPIALIVAGLLLLGRRRKFED